MIRVHKVVYPCYMIDQHICLDSLAPIAGTAVNMFAQHVSKTKDRDMFNKNSCVNNIKHA